MKVCLVTPEFLPNYGGIGTYCAELSRELSHLVDLSVLTVNRTLVGGERAAREIESYLGDRASIHLVSDGSDNFTGTALFQLKVMKALKRLNSREEFDVVHSQHGNMPDLL